MAGAWEYGGERGLLNEVEKEDVPVPDNVTFHPELISNEDLRNRAQSSGYGSVVPEPKPELEAWDPEATGAPDLDGGAYLDVGSKLRSQVPSSKYGKKIPGPKKELPKKPRPPFRPQCVRSETAKRMIKQAPSSGYGRKIAHKKSPQKEPVPKPKTKFSGSAQAEEMRKQAPSSKYGKSEAKLKIRKSTNAFQALDDNPDKPVVMTRKISSSFLLQDKGETEPEEEPIDPEKDFVLDGLRVHNHLNPMSAHKLSLKYIPTTVVERELPPSPLKWHARSSGYGSPNWEPPRNVIEREEKDEPTWNITRAPLHKVADEAEMELAEKLATETRQKLHVQSSNYGKHFPDVIPREEKPDAPQPWVSWTRSPKGSRIPDPPPISYGDEIY
eukprot:m.80596 g.80596  ORF g.80596 m.80596 type:complete len:385 (+) comp12768_c0_seq1:364-1518(+)